ncbi:MAG: hypothetical protein ACP5I4_00480 [Oceanipulchritudo sp.]
MTTTLSTRLVLGLLFLAAPVSAQEADGGSAPSIIAKSPFLPPGFQPPGGGSGAAAPPPQARQYEFRGVYEMGGRYFFNLYDTRQQKGSWVTREESGEDTPRIIEFDRENDVLVLDSSGQRISLNLIETSDKVLPLSVNRPATPTARPAAAPATRTTPQRTAPARRRVIRPSGRSDSDSSTTRRRVIRPVSRNPNR